MPRMNNTFVQKPFFDRVLSLLDYTALGRSGTNYRWRSKTGIVVEIEAGSISDSTSAEYNLWIEAPTRSSLVRAAEAIKSYGGRITGEPGPRWFCHAVFAEAPGGLKFLAYSFAPE